MKYLFHPDSVDFQVHQSSAQNAPSCGGRALQIPRTGRAFPWRAKHFRKVCGVLVLGLLGQFMSASSAQDGAIDFESLSPEFPGWTAIAANSEGAQEHRAVSKWDTPVHFSLDAEKPHSGSSSMKCDVVEELPGTLIFGPPALAAKGEVELRFFVRSEGLHTDGTISLEEYDDGKKRLSGYRTKVKIPLSDEWQEVIWSGRLKPETTGLRVRFVFAGIPSGGKIWLDDLAVKAVAE